MKFFNKIIGIFKSYDYRDKVLSVVAIAVFFLMMVKMMVFPYGIFNLGEPNIYTEGLVSKVGIQNLNPLFVDYNDADREICTLIFSGLMKYDPDKKAIVDDMAVMTINEDKTIYTFVLREGLKWQDNTPLTADDVYYTFHDVILAPSFSNEILKANFAGVKVEKVDEKTLKFTLDKPNVFFTTNLTVGILPKHLLSDLEPDQLIDSEFNIKPVGSGPYMVKEPATAFGDGRMQITLTRNPYYYGEFSEIENLRFIVYQTNEDLLGEINFINAVPKLPGEYKDELAGDDRFKFLPYELPQYTAVFLNMESEILKSSKVRLALQKAIDKKQLIDSLKGKIPVDTPLMELKQEEWEYKPNLDEANDVLKNAGYKYAKDDTEKKGFRYDSDAKPLQLNLIARLYNEGTDQFEESSKVITFLKDQWKAVGFDIKVEFLFEDEFKQRIMSRKYDLLYVGQKLGYNLDTYSYWHSSQASPMGQNLSNYKSFQVDSIIEAIRSTFDLTERDEELKKLAEEIKKDIPAIFLYRPAYYYAMDGKATGISMKGVVFPGDRFSRISLWKF